MERLDVRRYTWPQFIGQLQLPSSHVRFRFFREGIASAPDSELGKGEAGVDGAGTAAAGAEGSIGEVRQALASFMSGVAGIVLGDDTGEPGELAFGLAPATTAVGGLSRAPAEEEEDDVCRPRLIRGS